MLHINLLPRSVITTATLSRTLGVFPRCFGNKPVPNSTGSGNEGKRNTGGVLERNDIAKPKLFTMKRSISVSASKGHQTTEQNCQQFTGQPPSRPKVDIYTDASHLGTSAFYNGKWFFYPWPETVKENLGISWMDVFPTVVAARLWGSLWPGHEVKFHVSDILSTHSSWRMEGINSPERNVLMTNLRISADKYNFRPSLSYPIGSDDNIAFLISRNRVDEFHKQFPGADRSPTPIPDDVVEDLIPAVDSRPTLVLIIRNGVIPEIPDHLKGHRVAEYILDSKSS